MLSNHHWTDTRTEAYFGALTWQKTPKEGFAVDFRMANIPTYIVAKYIVKKLDFDRLYFYGDDRPLHVSATRETPKKAVVIFNKTDKKRTPKTLTADKFLVSLASLS